MNSGRAEPGKIKYKILDRSQMSLRSLDVERLIAADHPARVIWEIAGKMPLDGFAKDSKTREGEAGRPCWPPRLLMSIWVYSYTLKIASARAIERLLAYEPGLRWLAAGEEVNHHTLADFRVGHQEALENCSPNFWPCWIRPEWWT
jgi:transposase